MKNFLTPLSALAASLREMKEIFYVEASDDTRSRYATRGFKFYLSLPIRLKFLLGRGGAEGAILAKRPFTLLRLATASRSAAQTPPRSLRVRGGDALFLNKALLG